MKEGFYSFVEGGNAPDIVGFGIALIFFSAGFIITMRDYLKYFLEIKRIERESERSDK